MAPATQISSSLTAFNKWVFPALWLLFLVLFVGDALRDGAFEKGPMFVIGPLFMVVVGFLVMRYLVWDLADSVYDHGTHLVAKRNGHEVKIPLENIMNVSASMFTSPRRVTLRLVKPGVLGTEIAFSPKLEFSLNPFAKSRIAEELMERAYKARVSNAR